MTLPKLNLRDLFWLVVVVAIGLGWAIEHWSHAQLQEKVRRLKAVGLDVDSIHEGGWKERR